MSTRGSVAASIAAEERAKARWWHDIERRMAHETVRDDLLGHVAGLSRVTRNSWLAAGTIEEPAARAVAFAERYIRRAQEHGTAADVTAARASLARARAGNFARPATRSRVAGETAYQYRRRLLYNIRVTRAWLLGTGQYAHARDRYQAYQEIGAWLDAVVALDRAEERQADGRRPVPTTPRGTTR